MKHTWIKILAILIAILSSMCSFIGLLSNKTYQLTEFISLYGEHIELYGLGLYHLDSVSVAAQGIASDFITLVVGIPMLVISLWMFHRKSFKGQILLTGTLAYMLYTYMSYTFLWMYNPLFIIYVILMSMSLFAFILLMMSFDHQHIQNYFTSHFPYRTYAVYQYIIGVFLLFLWLSKIFTSLTIGRVPEGLEHYTTLTIQAMDLGIIVPTAFISATLLIKKHPLGYILTSVVLVKGFTMLLSISAMMINMMRYGVAIDITSTFIFFLLALISVCIFIRLMSQINKSMASTI